MFVVRCLVMLLTFSIGATIALSATNVSAGEACPDISGFVVIGEAEKVTIIIKDLRLNARIDTGAKTSSLGVVYQQPFERDGRKWL